jgi:hypothetical protein
MNAQRRPERSVYARVRRTKLPWYHVPMVTERDSFMA